MMLTSDQANYPATWYNSSVGSQLYRNGASIITDRIRSMGKVMFSQVSTILFTGGRGTSRMHNPPVDASPASTAKNNGRSMTSWLHWLRFDLTDALKTAHGTYMK